ncbi:MAG: hypothetical protein ACJ8FY_26510 [Gemmataceae bacterium]
MIALVSQQADQVGPPASFPWAAPLVYSRRFRPRQSLAWGAGAFLALQLSLAIAIETCLPQFRDPDYANKLVRLRQRTIDADVKPLTVVMFGSSRTAFGLRGQCAEEHLAPITGRPTVVFNFGIHGYGPLAQLLLLKRVLAEGVRPDLVLVEILPAILTDERRNPEIQRTPVDRLWLSELSLMAQYGAPAKQWKRQWWLEWVFPWYTHRFAMMSLFRPAWLSWKERHDYFRACDASGWVNPPVQFTTPEFRRKATDYARLDYGSCLEDFHLGGPACKALREIAELGKREHVKVGFVVMPEGAEFQSWYSPASWAQVESFLAEMKDSGVTIINARNWVGDDGFMDSHHLFPSGAIVFSERLAREALPQLLRDESSSDH